MLCHRWAASFTCCVDMSCTLGVATVDMFHSREVLAVYVRCCWLERELGILPRSSPLASFGAPLRCVWQHSQWV